MMAEAPRNPAPPSLFDGSTVLLLAPATLVVIALFLIPMSAIAVSSLTTGRGAAAHFSLGNYTDIVSDSFYWEILLRTARVSVFTTITALLLSYPAALCLYFWTSRWRQVFLVAVLSPLFVSSVVRTYGWIVILSSNGALNAMLPEDLQLRLLQTEPAIVIGLTHIYIPFMLLSINASLTKIDKGLLLASTSLGASSLRAAWDVIVPLSVPGILAGCTIVFTVAMTAFSTPILLGGSHSKTMPYLIYQNVMLASDGHMGSALALFLLCATLLGVALLRVLTRSARRRDLT